jgi:hypothetical protein
VGRSAGQDLLDPLVADAQDLAGVPYAQAELGQAVDRLVGRVGRLLLLMGDPGPRGPGTADRGLDPAW